MSGINNHLDAIEFGIDGAISDFESTKTAAPPKRVEYITQPESQQTDATSEATPLVEESPEGYVLTPEAQELLEELDLNLLAEEMGSGSEIATELYENLVAFLEELRD